MSPEQVQEVLTSTESDRIERTRSTKDTDKFREAICSFSNGMPGHGKPGYIVFGKDVLGRFPGAYVQYVKFAGETMGSEVEESRVFDGNLMELMWKVSRFIESSFTEKPVYQGGLQERVIWDYPPEAMRELLVNAVLHRDYQTNSPVRFSRFPDRIEIQNTGGLYGEANPENFPAVTDYRNPVLAEVLLVMKYANRFGRGISRAQHLLAQNGNRPAEFHIGANFIKVTVFKHPER